MNKITYNVVGSTMKVIASSKVDVSEDLAKNDMNDNKTIAELLDEQEKTESNKE
jgi:hypothetical protein